MKRGQRPFYQVINNSTLLDVKNGWLVADPSFFNISLILRHEAPSIPPSVEETSGKNVSYTTETSHKAVASCNAP